MNLCANIIKKIRSMPDFVAEESLPEASPMSTAETTIKTVNRIKSASIAGYQKMVPKKTVVISSKKNIKAPSMALVQAVASTDRKPQVTARRRSSSEPLELTGLLLLLNMYRLVLHLLVKTEEL